MLIVPGMKAPVQLIKISGAALALALGSASLPAADRFVPTAAKLEPSGFATVERAPPVPYPHAPPAAENRPQNETEWYARDLGISVEEAAKRQREQQTLFPEFERLQGTLRAKEAGNYTSARMIHRPDWRYDLYFKRDPELTLAKYTANPRFRAVHARFTREELEALLKPWAERFAQHKLAAGLSIDDTFGTAELMMNVTEEEYRSIAHRQGWEPPPRPIRLLFAGGIAHPSIEDQARPYIRIFPQDSRATVFQLEAGFFGKITVRDGCLRAGEGAKAPLAYFHREVGIGIDDEGYLALKDRRTGKSRGRIGEWFSWAGPNGLTDDMPMVAELRAQCGGGPIMHVGNPESAAQFRVRSWVVDDLARRKRISREKAWRLLKDCWAKADAKNPDRPPNDQCNV